jgi:DUF4097 and DUF4098 domain-containing protein YvlB
MTRIKILLALSVGLVLLATPARADFKSERRLALAPGGTFTLDADVGAVTLTGDSTSGATVTVTSRRDDFNELYDMQFDEKAGSVTVTVKRRGSRLRGFWNGEWIGDNTHFAIQVPSKTTVNIKTSGGSIEASRLAGRLAIRASGGSLRVEETEGNVEGTTSGGSIRMRDVRGDVVASTSGGSIDITGVRGSLRATTSGGGIAIDTVSGELYASTSGGGVQVRGAGGRVAAHSSGGSVTVRFAAGNNRGGELSTSGGGVRTEVDPSVALTIDASSSGGGVDSELPITGQGPKEPFRSSTSLRGDLNGGGAVLRLRSSGCGVRISGTPRSAAR